MAIMVVHSSTSVQMKPLPMKPGLHVQVNEPGGLFEHVALTSQPAVPRAHSSISVQPFKPSGTQPGGHSQVPPTQVAGGKQVTPMQGPTAASGVVSASGPPIMASGPPTMASGPPPMVSGPSALSAVWLLASAEP